MIIKIKKNKIKNYSKQFFLAILISLILSSIINIYQKKNAYSIKNIDLKISNPVLEVKLDESIITKDSTNEVLTLEIFSQREFQNKILNLEKHLQDNCKNIFLKSDINIYKNKDANITNLLSTNITYKTNSKINDFKYVLKCNDILLDFLKTNTRYTAIKILENLSMKDESLNKIKNKNIFNEEFTMKKLELNINRNQFFENRLEAINLLGLLANLTMVVTELKDTDIEKILDQNQILDIKKLDSYFADISKKNEINVDIKYYPLKVLKTSIRHKNYDYHKIFLITFVFVLLVFFLFNNSKKIKIVH